MIFSEVGSEKHSSYSNRFSKNGYRHENQHEKLNNICENSQIDRPLETNPLLRLWFFWRSLLISSDCSKRNLVNFGSLLVSIANDIYRPIRGKRYRILFSYIPIVFVYSMIIVFNLTNKLAFLSGGGKIAVVVIENIEITTKNKISLQLALHYSWLPRINHFLTFN